MNKSTFNLSEDYINKIKNINNKNMLERLSNIDDIINRNKIKYNLNDVRILDNLSYNIVAEATSQKYGNVIIKIIIDDSMNSSEIAMLKLYNGKFACKLLEENSKDNVYILEKLSPGNKLIDLQNLENSTEIICNLINNLVIPYNDNIFNLNIPFYNDILNKAFSYAENINYFSEYISFAQKIYLNIRTKNLPLYYLHNDLHHYNILKSGNEYKAIDPHGVIGEKIFEYPPYIINEFWNNNFNCNHIMKVINKVSKYSKENRKDILEATYIHLLLSTIWFKEDNMRDDLIKNNLSCLNFLKEVLNK